MIKLHFIPLNLAMKYQFQSWKSAEMITGNAVNKVPIFRHSVNKQPTNEAADQVNEANEANGHLSQSEPQVMSTRWRQLQSLRDQLPYPPLINQIQFNSI